LNETANDNTIEELYPPLPTVIDLIAMLPENDEMHQTDPPLYPEDTRWDIPREAIPNTHKRIIMWEREGQGITSVS
jgi:hypothetical protein